MRLADHPTVPPTNLPEPQDLTGGSISAENKYDLPMQVASEQAQLLQQQFYPCVYYREIEEDPEQDDPILNALLHDLLMAHEWRLDLQPIHITHTTAWLESSISRVGTTKRIPTHGGNYQANPHWLRHHCLSHSSHHQGTNSALRPPNGNCWVCRGPSRQACPLQA